MSEEVTPSGEAPPPWASAPYSIKRHGISITHCDTEPVHTPGCIQDHGALLVVRPSDLTILQASENLERWLGRGAEAVLGRALGELIGEAGAQRVRAALENEPIDRNPLYVLTLPARTALPPLDVTVHTIDGVAVLEFEATGRADAGKPDYYALVRKTVGRLQHAQSLLEFCQIVTAEVRELTGFDRVMVYRFHPDLHGEVFAESRRDDLAPWLGLHYPAEDIPRPAREMFLQIWVRPTPDVGAPVHELAPLVNPDNGRALTMTHCALRGASVMYTEYLQNMKVTAGLTMPIRRGTELWGLIACHHYHGARHVPYPVRAACEFIAQVASLQHKSSEEREHLLYRLQLDGVHQQLVAQAAQEGGLAAITDGRPSLLDGMMASGAALYHRDRWWPAGRTPTTPQLDALASWLAEQPGFSSPTRPAYVTDALASVYPPAAAFTDVASGLLAVPLARRGRNMLLWFRPETLQSVRWGGNPHDKPTVTGPHGPRLTPRVSFELFVESVRQRALPWTSVEVDAAARLRLLLMELVVTRAEQLAHLNADLSRSNEELDAFAYVASHDLKEPLRGIHKYAHELLEEAATADAEHRRKLEAIARLTVRMDSLLDSLLHFSRVGRMQLALEPTALDDVVDEAIESVAGRTGNAGTRIERPRALPKMACDHIRVREVFVNLIANALKYNTSRVKEVVIGYIAPQETVDRTGFPHGAREDLVLFVRDNGIGIASKHYDHIFQMFRRLHGRDDFGGGTGAGLTIARRLVECHGGQIWLASTPGQVTTFYFTLPVTREVAPDA